jgi:hypothetical protein
MRLLKACALFLRNQIFDVRHNLTQNTIGEYCSFRKLFANIYYNVGKGNNHTQKNGYFASTPYHFPRSYSQTYGVNRLEYKFEGKVKSEIIPVLN